MQSRGSSRGGFQVAVLLFFIATSAATIFVAERNIPSDFSKQQTFVAPPKEIKYFVFGYNETAADSFWIRLLQNFDECGVAGIERDQLCNNSWAFRMLDLITDLAPRFRMAVIHGATVLSVITHDRVGAGAIFQKGIDNFPRDWSIEYRAAYHFLVELNDKEKAAEYFKRAYRDGGPTWIPALVGRLMTETGKLEIAEKFLEDILKDMDEGANKYRVETRLREVREQLRIRAKSTD